MIHKDELIALAERVEALTGPDREVAHDVLRACGWTTEGAFVFNPNGIRHMAAIPDPTASLDAAMSLVPEGWVSVHGWDYPNRASRAIFMDDDGDQLFRGRAATPALALTAAALRAIAKIEGQQP